MHFPPPPRHPGGAAWGPRHCPSPASWPEARRACPAGVPVPRRDVGADRWALPAARACRSASGAPCHAGSSRHSPPPCQACSSPLPVGIWSTSARCCDRGALRSLLRAPSHSCQLRRDLPFIAAAAGGILFSHLLQRGLFTCLGRRRALGKGCAPSARELCPGSCCGDVSLEHRAVPPAPPRGHARPPDPGAVPRGDAVRRLTRQGGQGAASRAAAREFPGGAHKEPHGPAEPHRTAGGYCSGVIYSDFYSDPWQSMIAIDT